VSFRGILKRGVHRTIEFSNMSIIAPASMRLNRLTSNDVAIWESQQLCSDDYRKCYCSGSACLGLRTFHTEVAIPPGYPLVFSYGLVQFLAGRKCTGIAHQSSIRVGSGHRRKLGLRLFTANISKCKKLRKHVLQHVKSLAYA
jgi:hypothetical protein